MSRWHSAQRNGNQLCNGKSKPHGVYVTGVAQQPGGRHQHNQLADHRNQQRQRAAPQRLERGGRNYVETCHRKMDGNNAQGQNTHGQHGGAGVEHTQQHMWENFGQNQAAQHNALGKADSQFDGLGNALGLAGTVIVADNGHHAVVNAKNRHEYKALQLEVDTKHRNGGAGKGNQDVVHRKGHHAANGVHGNGGDAHRVNALDGGPRRAEAFQR